MWKGVPAPGDSLSIYDWDVTARLSGQEKVTVPAGTFDAVRIGVEGSRQSSGMAGTVHMEATRFQHQVWHAPAVKRKVKETRISLTRAGDLLDRDT